MVGSVITMAIVNTITWINESQVKQKQFESEVKLQRILQDRRDKEQEVIQERHKQELQKQIEDLKQRVETKQKQPAVRLANAVVPQAQAATGKVNCKTGEGDAKAFIYFCESGNNPGAINKSSGACGLGQALPCSKMNCSLSDYACQDAWFTKYMLARYGSWENAKAFWLRMRWW